MPAASLEHLEQAKRLDGLGLPLQRERLDWLDPNGVADEEPRLGADERLPRRRGLLESRGNVDGVAGDERLALPADDDLARVDADPRLEPVRRNRRAHLGRGANCTQCVVLVGHRNPEDGHHRVADELLDDPAVPLDDLRGDPRSSGACASATPPDRWTPRAQSSRRGRRRES